MQRFEEFLNEQTTYRQLMLAVMDICKTERTFETVMDFLSGYPAIDRFTLSALEIIDVMKDFEGISMRFDEDAGVEYLQTTAYGLEILDKYDSSKVLTKLLDENANLSNLYRNLLKFCIDGKTLEEANNEFGSDEGLKKEKVFVSYCVRELEKAGGVRWHGDVWKTTDAGVKFV